MSQDDPLVDLISANRMLSSRIRSGRPFALGRLGSVEAQLIGLIENNSQVSLRNRKLAWVNAGIAYPTTSQLKDFSRQYCSSLMQLELIARWPESIIPNQEYLWRKYSMPNAEAVPLRILDPVQSCSSGVSVSEIWTQELAGKNVLVISPFANTIAAQYAKHDDLHQLPILPKFTLETLVPPVTNGATFWKGSYSNNLDQFRLEIQRQQSKFKAHIALVSAGAYGLPIMEELKTYGITSIYMGGSLQILFGIMGNRWREIDSILTMVTPSWVMTPKENRPFGYRLIENGSYW